MYQTFDSCVHAFDLKENMYIPCVIYEGDSEATYRLFLPHSAYT